MDLKPSLAHRLYIAAQALLLAAAVALPAPAQRPPRVVELSTSRQFHDDVAGQDVTVWRVVSVVGSERDTLAGIEVLRMPGFVSDTLVRGFAVDSTNQERFRFQWRPGRAVEWKAMPSVRDGAIEITADGASLIYILDLTSRAEAQGVVEPWDGGTAVLTPRVPEFTETDARWYSPHACPGSSPFVATFLWSLSLTDRTSGFLRHSVGADGSVHTDTIPPDGLPCMATQLAARDTAAPAAPMASALPVAVPAANFPPASTISTNWIVPILLVAVIFAFVGFGARWGVRQWRNRRISHEGSTAIPHAVLPPTQGSFTRRPGWGTRSSFWRVFGAVFTIIVVVILIAPTGGQKSSGDEQPLPSAAASASGAGTAESHSDACGRGNASIDRGVVVRSTDANQIALEIGSTVWAAATECPTARQLTLTTSVGGTDQYGSPTTRQVDQSIFSELDEVRRYRTASAYATNPPDAHTIRIAAAGLKVQCAFGVLDRLMCRE